MKYKIVIGSYIASAICLVLMAYTKSVWFAVGLVVICLSVAILLIVPKRKSLLESLNYLRESFEQMGDGDYEIWGEEGELCIGRENETHYMRFFIKGKVIKFEIKND